jgi:hypothetical protein
MDAWNRFFTALWMVLETLSLLLKIGHLAELKKICISISHKCGSFMVVTRSKPKSSTVPDSVPAQVINILC